MSLREFIDRHRRVVLVVMSLVILAALFYIGRHLLGRNDQLDASQNVFYSCDDGKTFFSDRMDRIVPFDHEGMQAFRAAVYRCDQGTPFVAFLMQPDDIARKELDTAQSQSPEDFRLAVLRTQRQVKVKRPGERAWVGIDSAEGTKIIAAKCPNVGSDVPTPVSP